MKIRPLQDRILVKRIDEEETTKGGIIIPDTAKEKPSEGKVIAVGKGKVSDDGKVHPLDVKKGDRVLFSKYAGTEVQVEGDEHISDSIKTPVRRCSRASLSSPTRCASRSGPRAATW
ncbi:MAG: co-chaperone GroES [Deltaproteobacteria bacterium]|nr:MAG: co-chaperone GroES [Deltaproteobacteria bacterium]